MIYRLAMGVAKVKEPVGLALVATIEPRDAPCVPLLLTKIFSVTVPPRVGLAVRLTAVMGVPDELTMKVRARSPVWPTPEEKPPES
jgi:hypothetical protein